MQFHPPDTRIIIITLQIIVIDFTHNGQECGYNNYTVRSIISWTNIIFVVLPLHTVTAASKSINKGSQL